MPPVMPDGFHEALHIALREVFDRAWCPYSKFRVAAVAVSDSGRFYSGVNVENAAYPQGWCAETSALGAMVTAGETKLSAIAVMGAGAELCTPCGGCRQRIREFGADSLPVLIFSPDGLREETTLGRLLPQSFGPDNLA